jgi:hypothetical protein
MWCKLFGACAGLMLVACTSQASVAVRTAHEEFRCPEEELLVDELESDRYRVRGCGRAQVYQCVPNVPCQHEGWLAARAKERAEREFDCPDGKLKVRWVQDETYRVEGCGHAATYACSADGCEPEGGRTTEVVVVP